MGVGFGNIGNRDHTLNVSVGERKKDLRNLIVCSLLACPVLIVSIPSLSLPFSFFPLSVGDGGKG